MEITITELKKNLPRYVARAQRGETIIITYRGRPAGKLVPYTKPDVPRRVGKDDPSLYKGIDLNEPIMDSIG